MQPGIPSDIQTVFTIPILGVLIAGAVTIIGALAAAAVTMITAWRTIAQKVASIEGHVNSEKTAAEGREATLKVENTLLREMLVEKKQVAALLAQAASHPVPRERSTDSIAAPAIAASLENIDTQTKAIEANTAKEP